MGEGAWERDLEPPQLYVMVEENGLRAYDFSLSASLHLTFPAPLLSSSGDEEGRGHGGSLCSGLMVQGSGAPGFHLTTLKGRGGLLGTEPGVLCKVCAQALRARESPAPFFMFLSHSFILSQRVIF